MSVIVILASYGSYNVHVKELVHAMYSNLIIKVIFASKIFSITPILQDKSAQGFSDLLSKMFERFH